MADYLPDNVSYSADETTLTHTYFGGSQAETDLGTLEVESVDLLAEAHRRVLSQDERKSATLDIW